MGERRAARSSGIAGPRFWVPSGGGELLADPTLLPEATSPGQTRHASFTYGRSLSAGQSYTDPITGVYVLKYSSATVPFANSGINHGYASGGPRCSQPWVSGGKTHYTTVLDFGGGFLDIRDEGDGTLTAINYRGENSDALGPGDVGMCFSLHPSTPRISYYMDAGVLRRFNTDTMLEENATGFPKTVVEGGNITWLQSQVNDVWFAMVQNPGTDGIFWGYKPSTNTLVQMTPARSGQPDTDECHLDKKDPIIYMYTGDDDTQNAPWNLETDTFDLTPNGHSPTGPMTGSHVDGGLGYVVGSGSSEDGGGCFIYEGLPDVMTKIIATANGYHSDNADYYTNAGWVMNLPPGYADPSDLWHITSREFQDNASAKVRRYAIACVKNDGSSVRIVCHHDSIGPGYDQWSKPFFSPDGKLVFFTSDMNGSGRFDAFVAKMPVS